MLTMMAKHVINRIVCEPPQPCSAIITMLGSKQLQGSGVAPSLSLQQIKATTHALIQALLLLVTNASHNASPMTLYKRTAERPVGYNEEVT